MFSNTFVSPVDILALLAEEIMEEMNAFQSDVPRPVHSVLVYASRLHLVLFAV